MEFNISLFVILISIQAKSYCHVKFNVSTCWNYEHYDN